MVCYQVISIVAFVAFIPIHFGHIPCFSDAGVIHFGSCSMKWVELKMTELGVLNNPNYKITALLDHLAMITVQSDTRGIFDCKPLGLIWALLPEVFIYHTSSLCA